MRAKAVALTCVVPKLHFLVTDQVTRSKFRRPFTWSISARDSLVDVGCSQTVSSSKLAVLSDRLHEEIKGAFLTFQKDADQIYPGWKEKLGYTGESSVQAASFDWAKRA